MTGVVLGLDSGGTKTRMLWVDRAGQIVARNEGDSLDPVTEPDWEARLRSLLAERPKPDFAVLGLPRHGEVTAISEAQVAAAERLFGPQVSVRNDVEVAFIGALGGGDGVLILSGTGSMAWARGPSGELRVGGWGDVFGDEGSAWWIGREALSVVARMLDGRLAQTSFAGDLLARIGTTSDELNAWVYGPGGMRSGMAAIALHVADLAEAGDASALALLRAAAGELALHHKAAVAQTGLNEPCRWSYAGGVFHSATVLQTLAGLVGNPPASPVLPPEAGAALEAARLAGWTTGDAFISCLSQSTARSLQPER